MRRLSIAVVILVVAIALAVLTPRLGIPGPLAGKAPTACISINFSKDCAAEGALPMGAGPYVETRVP